MRIVVLGAGVIGVTSAWYLAREGHEVTVIDRQPGPALETSFANGGQISVSHAEPWANPRAPLQIFKWLLQEESPLLWRLRADVGQWAWGLEFLRQCTPARTRANIRTLVELGLYSRQQLQHLRAELGLDYDQRLRGILHIYTRSAQFRHACVQAEWMRQFGCERIPVDAAEAVRIEPALANASVPVCGGTYTRDDESGDAHVFTRELASRAGQAGVRFDYGRSVSHLHRRGDRIDSVELSDYDRITADAYVVACGSYSTGLLRTADLHIPVCPAKGYSATFNDEAPEGGWPSVSLTDDEHKLVFSRLGCRLRVAGTAEFNGLNVDINDRRSQSIVRRARQLFPVLGASSDITYWAGLRPATPGNLPLIGRGGLSNLWLNTGHGTLGWTLACGSARLLADMVSERVPAVQLAPCAVRQLSAQ